MAAPASAERACNAMLLVPSWPAPADAIAFPWRGTGGVMYTFAMFDAG